MSEVVELRPAILKRLSKEFVDKYVDESPELAALWLLPQLERHEHDRMRELINWEFLGRGYIFPETTND